VAVSLSTQSKDDVVELLYNGVSLETPLKHTITTAELTAHTFSFSVPASSFTDADGTGKTLSTRVADAAGNATSSGTLGLTKDVTSPETNGTDYITFSGTTLSIPIAADLSGVQEVKWGTASNTWDQPATITNTLPVKTATLVTATLTAPLSNFYFVMYDAAGNRSVEKTITYAAGPVYTGTKSLGAGTTKNAYNVKGKALTGGSFGGMSSFYGISTQAVAVEAAARALARNASLSRTTLVARLPSQKTPGALGAQGSASDHRAQARPEASGLPVVYRPEGASTLSAVPEAEADSKTGEDPASAQVYPEPGPAQSSPAQTGPAVAVLLASSPAAAEGSPNQPSPGAPEGPRPGARAVAIIVSSTWKEEEAPRGRKNRSR
jgi:hypothetical protein